MKAFLFWGLIFLILLIVVVSITDDPDSEQRAWVTSDHLNRRSCPSTQCGIVGQFTNQQKVKVYEEKNGWSRVSKYHSASCSNGQSGSISSGNNACSPDNGIEGDNLAEWVSSAYISTRKTEDTLVETRSEKAQKAVDKGKNKKRNLYDNPSKQIAWIGLSKDAVRSRLREPSSATFRNVIFHVYEGRMPMVCGEVNAKNGFGGYTGYQGFIASGDALVFLESELEAGEFVKSWNMICVK